MEDIEHFAPKTWQRNSVYQEFELLRSSEEFENVEYDIKRAVKNAKIKSISRVQNLHDFGQFLLRSQILEREFPGKYYKVRRYVEIPAIWKGTAMAHNLDHRRLGYSPFTFKSHLGYVNRGTLIFVVVILTDKPKSRQILPTNFTDYYIDYIVQIQCSM